MKIVIVGCGKVGSTLAEQLSTEDHDITIIDTNEEHLRATVDKFDVMGIYGNGATIPVLREAGIENTDLLIAATAADELNLLSCLIGKRVGAKNTIARVRNPEYVNVIAYIKEDLGLSMAINPEFACANEMARLLKFPSMIEVDTFAKGRVELLQFDVPENSPIIGMPLSNMSTFEKKILVCAVERKENVEDEQRTNVYIPSGNFCIEAGDRLSIVGEAAEEMEFFNKIGINSNRINSILIIGGGKIAYYLAKQMIKAKVSVKIIESKYERCTQLADMLPDADIVHGDGTDQQLLLEEGIGRFDAFAALTGLDEENIMLSLFAGKISKKIKLLTKITRNPFTNVLSTLNLGSIFYPRIIAAEHILRYVRAMQNSYGSNVETLCKIIDDKAEALEFKVSDNSSITEIPLAQLKTKENLLIGTINRNGQIIIPSGSDVLKPGDTVIVITTNKGLNKLEDIIK